MRVRQERADRQRRTLLKGIAGAGLAGAAKPIVAATQSDSGMAWAMEADLVIVGSGVAGTCAAIAATKAGASVIMAEKMPFAGGTTAKSAGVFWIPNNPVLRASGARDERLDTLRYMVRLAQPTLFRADHPTLGIDPDDYLLLGAFVDNANRVVEELVASTGLRLMAWQYAEGQVWPDYYGHLAENKVPKGRSIVCDVKAHPDRHFWAAGGGAGNSLLWQLQQGFEQRPIKLLLDHAVQVVTRNAVGEVNGVVVDSGEAAPIRIRAKRAVLFASGGFTHNVAMADSFLRGRIWGGCAAPGSTGDFVGIAAGLGAPLANMNNAWWAQVPVEVAIKTRSVPFNVWCPPGDSMIQVNRYGERFGNEKIAYNERTQLHFAWDPLKLEYPNRLGFMIWDTRTAQYYAGYDPIPAPNAKLEYVIEGATLAELQSKIEARLAAIAEHTGGVKLAPEFAANLVASVKRFNAAAEKGRDEDFHRGETPNEKAWQFVGLKPAPNPYPNLTMHPIAASGPYYAVILGAGTLDTKGGPRTNVKGQVLNAKGAPIPGLYGAGNCVASPAGHAYWGGGGTIGPAMTFGYLAGTAAAAEPIKDT